MSREERLGAKGVASGGFESAFHSVGRVVMVVVGNMAWGL